MEGPSGPKSTARLEKVVRTCGAHTTRGRVARDLSPGLVKSMEALRAKISDRPSRSGTRFSKD